MLTGNANYIITTLRVGGDESRVRDERIALSHNTLGQETTERLVLRWRYAPSLQFWTTVG